MSPGVGIFGGTFNPIHVGHLRAAEQVVEQLGLERMLFVPAGDPPHKRGDALAPAALRLEWVRAAVAGNKRFEADPLEVERSGPSFSIDTVRAVAARTAPERPVFVVGVDALREMDTWRDPAALVAEAHLAVMARPGWEGPLSGAFPPELRAGFEFADDGRSASHRRTPSWARWLAISALDVSATDIRRRLGQGLSIRYLVPDSIFESVMESGCFRESD